MFELVNTSLPNGLIPGTHGFATVAMTRSLADNLRRRLEDLSTYVHKTSAHDATYDTLNPVAWSHLILPRGEHVLGRVAAAPFDYTGRTNRLARLVCLTAAEAKTDNAAETLLRENAYFTTPWEGEARWLEPDTALTARFGAPSARASRKSQAWIEAFGESDGSRYAAGFAALLRDAIRQNGRPLAFVSSQQSDPDGRRALAFIADLIALLPDDLRPNATFSTYPCAIPIGIKCAIRVLRKDDNGYAQAVAGVPVADFAAKTVQNANRLPRDAELEHLAATGSLPAPAASTKSAPKVAITGASAAKDEAIDVSIDIPPTTEANEAIAVTAKDASRRKPSLKHRPVQSAPMPGQRFDPLFGQPRKRSQGPLIAAVAAGGVLILALAAVLLLLSKPHASISGDDASVQTAQDDEQERMREQFEREKAAEARSTADEEKRRREEEEAIARAEAERTEKERLARERVSASTKTPSVAANTPSGKVQPLYNGITEIVLCKDDAEAKDKFGHPRKEGLSAGSVWHYGAGGLCEFNFSDKAGKDWDELPGDSSRFELVSNKRLPVGTRYCRIWHFAKKPETLYWVTGNDGGTEFALAPPHNDAPVNLAERLTGPDLRILAQWEAHFGKVSCQAWSADGTNRLDWQDVDAAAFVASAFIAKCHALRLTALNKKLEATSNDWQRAVQSKTADLNTSTTRKKELEAELKKAETALKPLADDLKKAQDAYDKANKAFEDADQAFTEANRTANAKIKRLESELDHLKKQQMAASKGSDKNSFDPQIAKKQDELDVARREVPEKRKIREDAQIEFEKADRELKAAQKRYDKKEADLGIAKMKKEKSELDTKIESITNGPTTLNEEVTKLRTEIAKFPTVAEAQKQWTIHVRVDLGGAKQ